MASTFPSRLSAGEMPIGNVGLGCDGIAVLSRGDGPTRGGVGGSGGVTRGGLSTFFSSIEGRSGQVLGGSVGSDGGANAGPPTSS